MGEIVKSHNQVDVHQDTGHATHLKQEVTLIGFADIGSYRADYFPDRVRLTEAFERLPAIPMSSKVLNEGSAFTIFRPAFEIGGQVCFSLPMGFHRDVETGKLVGLYRTEIKDPRTGQRNIFILQFTAQGLKLSFDKVIQRFFYDD